MEPNSFLNEEYFAQRITQDNMKEIFTDCYDVAFELAESNDKLTIKNIYDLYQEQLQNEWVLGRVRYAILQMVSPLTSENKQRLYSRCFPGK
ncbi:hypothetical protein BIT28_27825 [Photobacterium proteolyticum]|uniref:Uncharacterized protein n=1 Tax=Photobacterium proteolyticum TaxID=1903952 RepID=A0A1Q9H7Q2_9GAMM|nr:hypothetical protein [Photobacterium proteolyticum]OLQ83777.1 hypothetical protein BIT28_27825 [Photobacterium proteolyticum]